MKALLKYSIIQLLTLYFSKQRCKYHNPSQTNAMQTSQGHFTYCQLGTHVQTENESHDLNMEFPSFNNGFKLLCSKVFMQESFILFSGKSEKEINEKQKKKA